MRYWVIVSITGVILFALTLVLGLSVIGVDIFGPDVEWLESKRLQSYHGSQQPNGQSTDTPPVNNDSNQGDVNTVESTLSQEEDAEPNGQEPYTKPLGQKHNPTPADQKPSAEPAGTESISSGDVQAAQPVQEQPKKIQSVTFSFSLSAAAFITVDILDSQGKTIATPVKDKPYRTGSHTIPWQAEVNGKPLEAGNYYYLIREKNVGIPILLYHEISGPEEINPYTESINDFRAQMNYLKENNYSTLSLQQLGDYLEKGTSIPEKSVLITFGDGYASSYTRAQAVLREHDFSAVVFILGSFLDLDDDRAAKPLTSTQLADLAGDGVIEIGSHTYDLHQAELLKPQPRESASAYTRRLKNDFEKINNLIKEKTGKTPEALSWPGPVTAAAVTAAQQSGYKYQFTVNSAKEYSGNRFGDSLTDIKRQYIMSSITLQDFANIVQPNIKTKVSGKQPFKID